MNKVLGGFKNMLRQWRINLRLKKSKKEKKKHPKAKSFVYSLLAILYAPFGYLFNFNDKTKVKSKVEPMFKELDLKLKQVTKEEIVNFEKIDQQIETLQKEVSLISSKKINQYYQQKLNQIIIKKDDLKQKINKSLPKEENKNIDSKIVNNKNNVNRERIKDDLKFRPFPLVSNPIKRKEPINLKKANHLTEAKKVKSLLNTKEVSLNFIKDANKDLKKDYEVLSTIEEKIKKTTVYNHFYDLENQLKVLRKKIEQLKEKYYEIEDSFDRSIYLKEDHYELLKNTKSIDDILKRIEDDFKAISSKKKIIFYEKKPQKQNNKQNDIKRKNAGNLEEKNLKKESKIDLEAIKAQELVVENIIEQNRYFENYLKKITKSTNRKKTLFSSLLNFSKNIVNFTVSFLPLSFFKNKLLGSLVSTIMLNNSIKTMRKMTDPNLEIDYLLLKEYKNHQQMLIDIYKISNDSLMELTVLKNRLLTFYNNDEARLLLEQIMTIEKNIIKQLEMLRLKDKKINKVLVKIKQ